MTILTTIEEAVQYGQENRRSGIRTGFVPTMGALHEGHLSLVRASVAESQKTVVSIFVNPTQFGVGEDLDAYPRTIKEDLALLEPAGVDAVFLPDKASMYPPGFDTSIRVGSVSKPLCGQSRPTHFAGVATVVAKLFIILQPEFAYFGLKDYQQTVVIRQLVRDLNMPVRIVTCPVVREGDGLAMSSRNRYLTPQERQQAPVLHQALLLAQTMALHGDSLAAIEKAVRQEIGTRPLATIDYVEIRHPDTLNPVQDLTGGAVLALAVWFGNTRLIDNIRLEGAPL